MYLTGSVRLFEKRFPVAIGYDIAKLMKIKTYCSSIINLSSRVCMPRDLDFKYLIKILEQNRLTTGADICVEAKIYFWNSLMAVFVLLLAITTAKKANR
jgi:hypothetical protein